MIKNIVIILVLFFFLFNVKIEVVQAVKCDCGGDKKADAATLIDCPKACKEKHGSGSGGTVQLTNPLTGESTNISPQILIGKIINAILGIVGSLALVMFIYGGITWMTAAGNSENVTKGKNIIIWAAIGLVVIFTSYALVKFVFSAIGV
ncbi:MAG: pilin [Patescibacteria group bacterium]